MSDRPGKSRPMPAAPYDDPSIPVLTERLTLPALELDITLPPVGAETEVRKQDDFEHAATRSADAPAPAPPPTPPPRDLPSPPPALLGAEFESDTWLVETIPMAPPPLDLSILDLPTFDLPPLTPPPPAVSAPTEPAAVPASSEPDIASTLRPSGSSEAGFASADVVIPASLMRALPVAAPFASPSGSAPIAAIEAAPTFDRLPPATAVDARPSLEAAAPSAAAVFAVLPPGAAAVADWSQIETELRESILRAVSQHLPQAVETMLQRQLAPVIDSAIDTATAQLAAEIRHAATHTLRELVDHAVEAELARLLEPGQR